jgi:hypothetical protein
MKRKSVFWQLVVMLLTGLMASGTASALVYDTDVLTGATIVGPADDQDGVLYGDGNQNGGFTLSDPATIELGLRTHQRYPVAGDDFNAEIHSNGDGTYSWNTGGWGPGSARGEWNFDWSIFVSSGTLTDYTYEIGVDYDASANAQYATWDLINNPGIHADHATLDGSGNVVGALTGPDDLATNYANNIGAGVAAQNSWNMAFLNNLFPAAFDPNAIGTYDIYLDAYDGSTLVAHTAITVLVGGGAPVPEPATMTVFGLGLAGMAVAGWRKKRNQA